MNLLWTLLFTFSVLAGNKIVDDNSTEYSLPAEFRLNGKSTQAAFGTARERALLTTARLIRNDKLIAMGAIVSPSGHILTKASSCVGARLATLSNGETFKLKIKKLRQKLLIKLLKLRKKLTRIFLKICPQIF